MKVLLHCSSQGICESRGNFKILKEQGFRFEILFLAHDTESRKLLRTLLFGIRYGEKVEIVGEGNVIPADLEIREDPANIVVHKRSVLTTAMSGMDDEGGYRTIDKLVLKPGAYAFYVRLQNIPRELDMEKYVYIGHILPK